MATVLYRKHLKFGVHREFLMYLYFINLCIVLGYNVYYNLENRKSSLLMRGLGPITHLSFIFFKHLDKLSIKLGFFAKFSTLLGS